MAGLQWPGELAFYLFQNVKLSRKRWVAAELGEMLHRVGIAPPG